MGNDSEADAPAVVGMPGFEGNIGGGRRIQVDIYGTVCTYKSGKAFLKVEGIAERGMAVNAAAKLCDKERMNCEEPGIRYLKVGEKLEKKLGKISFLSDGEILEVTAEDGLVCGAYETNVDANGGILVRADGDVRVEIFQVI